MTPTTYGRDFAYYLKSHGGVRGFYASLWRFLLRCTLFCHSVATFLTSVSSYEGGCGFEGYVEIHPPGCASNIVLLPLPPLSPLLNFARRWQQTSENRRARERFQHRFYLVSRQKKESQNLSCESVCRLLARLLPCVADRYYNQPLYPR